MTDNTNQPAVVTQESTNPLLSKIKLPGRIFRLPSGGYLYRDGELSDTCRDGEIHVKPMSALAEIKMKNPDMLFSGQAIVEVFQECIPEIKKPLELYGRDVDAIMCYLRVVTYGSTFEIEANHECEAGKPHNYDIDLEEVISKIKELDPTSFGKQYQVTMPNEQIVTLEPVRFQHVIQLLQTEDDKLPTVESIQKQMVNNLLMMINNVDGVTDKKNIAEWVQVVPANYITLIADAMQKSNNWGPSFEREVMCLDCGKPFKIELPVNPISFFTE